MHFIEKRIQTYYDSSVDGSDKPNNERGCWQYIKNRYLAPSPYNQEENNNKYGIDVLSIEKSFTMHSGGIDIIPDQYPANFTDLCNETMIHISPQEIDPYLRKDVPDLIARIFP